MRRVVALLAAALLTATALAACGGSGAEPGASSEATPARAATPATLVLDFQPNAVHSGIYAAQGDLAYREAGVDVTIRQPSSSADSAKLLEAGRAQFAILDIHDLGLAREHGLASGGIAPIVQRPLASVLARSDRVVRPRDLEGRRVGVTGVPSDDAVLDSIVSADGGDPSKVEKVTIGFNAISSLAAGKVDAATAFYQEAIDHPSVALAQLKDAVPSADPGQLSAEKQALKDADAFSPPGVFDRSALEAWAKWDTDHGLLGRQPDISQTFYFGR
jgi:putative hydroxymethylpyrimidine transport system substrate-binding protein